MAQFTTSRLLAFAKELQRASTFQELLEITRLEALASAGFEHVWLFISDTEEVREVRLIDYAGSQREAAWEVAPVLKVEGDVLMEQIVASDEPVVVEDARTDPRTNKAIVEALGNRTIINIPLRLVDKPFGAFGLGTSRPPRRWNRARLQQPPDGHPRRHRARPQRLEPRRRSSSTPSSPPPSAPATSRASSSR